MASDILSIDDLRIDFPTSGEADAVVVDGVSLAVGEGERLGLVGESGSGKSLTLLAALGLAPEHGRVAGTIRVAGRDLAELPPAQRRLVRGRVIGWIPQEPAASLNPTWRVGHQLAELVREHRGASRSEAHSIAAQLLTEVGLEPRRFAAAWPHELSGGEAQRVSISFALAGAPRLLLADEPTTALDLLTQAEILGLLEAARRERAMALVLVSHDLEVVASVVDRLVVLYAGRVVEAGPSAALLDRPLHPYTRELVAAASGLKPISSAGGAPPAATGCRYADRCPDVLASCRGREPALARAGPGHRVRCPVNIGPGPAPP